MIPKRNGLRLKPKCGEQHFARNVRLLTTCQTIEGKRAGTDPGYQALVFARPNR